MAGNFYKLLILMTNRMGPWVFVIISRVIAFGYFLFFPKRVAASTQFYKALFPKKRYPYHLFCTFLQYQNFTSVFLDRLLLSDKGDIRFTSTGLEKFERVLDNNKGAIIMMSHLGNWDVAAHLLQKHRKNLRLLLYMGVRHKEQIEQMQKKNLMEGGIKIIAVEKEGGSPFDIIEGVRFLKSDGVVSLAGDIIWRENQQFVSVRFLNHQVSLPEAPYVLAVLSGVPIFVFFSFRTNNNTYHFSFSDPIYIEKNIRSKRKEAIQMAAQQYAIQLEDAVRRHPFEWYHFKPFLGPEIGKENKS